MKPRPPGSRFALQVTAEISFSIPRKSKRLSVRAHLGMRMRYSADSATIEVTVSVGWRGFPVAPWRSVWRCPWCGWETVARRGGAFGLVCLVSPQRDHGSASRGSRRWRRGASCCRMPVAMVGRRDQEPVPGTCVGDRGCLPPRRGRLQAQTSGSEATGANATQHRLRPRPGPRHPGANTSSPRTATHTRRGPAAIPLSCARGTRAPRGPCGACRRSRRCAASGRCCAYGSRWCARPASAARRSRRWSGLRRRARAPRAPAR
jgi:hypothetical protein